MILHAVRELVLGMRHVVERVAVFLPLLFVAVQIVRVVPVIHRIRHFHLVHGPLDRPVKLEVRGCQWIMLLRILLLVEILSVQGYHAAPWSMAESQRDGQGDTDLFHVRKKRRKKKKKKRSPFKLARNLTFFSAQIWKINRPKIYRWRSTGGKRRRLKWIEFPVRDFSDVSTIFFE